MPAWPVYEARRLVRVAARPLRDVTWAMLDEAAAEKLLERRCDAWTDVDASEVAGAERLTALARQLLDRWR